MKTIEEVVTDKYLSDRSMPSKSRMEANDYVDWAKFGAREAQRWIPVNEEKPMAYESGNWDGLRTDYILLRNKYGKVFCAKAYIGHLDGHDFCDFVDDRDYALSDIIEWRPIERF